MIWHWIIFGILAFIVFLENICNLSKKNVIRMCTIIVLIVIFLSSIRWNQKIADWDSYYNVFQAISINKFSDLFFRNVWDFEFLFNLLMRIIKATTDNYLHVQIVMALIAIVFFYKSLLYFNTDVQYRDKKYGFGGHYIALALLLAWATECMNLYAVRTSLATSICLFSIRYIEKRDWKRFGICTLIAFGFHMSAIVFVPAYFIYNIRLDVKQISKYLFGAVLLSAIGAPALIRVAGLLGGRIGHKADGYNYALGSDYFGSVFTASGFIVLLKAFANTILVVLVALYITSRVKNDMGARPRVNGICNLYLFGAMLQVVFLPYSMLVARIAIFYINQQFFILPLLLQTQKKSLGNRLFIFIGLLAYAGLKMYMLLRGAEGYWTFNNIFQY